MLVRDTLQLVLFAIRIKMLNPRATFLIGAFGLSEELFTKVGFAFAIIV